MKNIFDLQHNQLQEFLKNKGESGFRAKQVWEGLYKHTYADWQDFTNLSKDLRKMLQENFSIGSLSLVDKISSTDDRSIRYLFELNDQTPVESVILRADDRLTLCISTQSGCPVGCVFCATGTLGLIRSLSSGEIVEQVIYLVRKLAQNHKHITNIVLMGMGEPFLNYEAILAAVKRFNDPNGMNIGARRITISTIGLPDKILRFAQEGLQINLAVSLHAPNDELRRELVPLAKKIQIGELIAACRQYVRATNRRITFEYVMIAGVNDQPEHAKQLADLLEGILCHVNLIGLNPTDHFDGKTPNHKVMKDFGRILLDKQIPTSIRNSQGSDIQAACGQLAGRSTRPKA